MFFFVCCCRNCWSSKGKRISSISFGRKASQQNSTCKKGDSHIIFFLCFGSFDRGAFPYSYNIVICLSVCCFFSFISCFVVVFVSATFELPFHSIFDRLPGLFAHSISLVFTSSQATIVCVPLNTLGF